MGQIFLIPLDVGNANNEPDQQYLDMILFYYIYYWVVFVSIFMLFPFLILYYETDETNLVRTRILRSSLKISIYLLIVIVCLIATYFLLRSQDGRSFSAYIIAF